MARSHEPSTILDSMGQDHLICGLCLEVLQTPKQLMCSHSFCLKCIKSHVGRMEGSLTCPLCQSESDIPKGGIDELPNNDTLNDLLADIHSYKQQFSKKKIKETSEYCQIHSIQTTALWCTDCESPVCTLCVVDTHKGHNFEAPKEVPKPQEIVSDSKSGQLSRKLQPKAEDLLFSIESQIKQTERDKRSLVATIDTRVELLKSKLDEIAEKAKVKVEEVYANVSQPLEDLKESTEENIETIKEEVDYGKGNHGDEGEHLEEICKLGMKLSQVEVTFLKYAASKQDSIEFKASNTEDFRELEKVFGKIVTNLDNEEQQATTNQIPPTGGAIVPRPTEPPPSYMESVAASQQPIPQHYTPVHMVQTGVPSSGYTQPTATPSYQRPPCSAGQRIPPSLSDNYHMTHVNLLRTIDTSFSDVIDVCITDNKDVVVVGKPSFISIRHQVKFFDFHGNLLAKVKKNIANIAYYNQHVYGLHEDKKMLYIFNKKGEVVQEKRLPFYSPKKLAIDKQGNVYIGSHGKDKIIYKKPVDHPFAKWAYYNRDLFSFCALTSGNFVVTDYGTLDDGVYLNTQVRLLNSKGEVLWAFQEKNHRPDVTSDPLGNILVTNQDKDRISVYSQDGGYHISTLNPPNGKFNCPTVCQANESLLVIAQNYGSELFLCKFC